MVCLNTRARPLSGRMKAENMAFRVKIDRDRCKGCELCVAFCRAGTLKMSENLNASGLRFADTVASHPCIGCKQCVIICPDAAIELLREEGN